jgi:hypothetical protein
VQPHYRAVPDHTGRFCGGVPSIWDQYATLSGGLGQAGRRDQQLPRSFFFDRLSKVLITGRDWYVLSHRGGGDQTVDKVSFVPL